MTCCRMMGSSAAKTKEARGDETMDETSSQVARPTEHGARDTIMY